MMTVTRYNDGKLMMTSLIMVKIRLVGHVLNHMLDYILDPIQDYILDHMIIDLMIMALYRRIY